jgi:hypothetical protein
MRPNSVLLVRDKDGKVVFHSLYYNERKAISACARFQKLDSDGSRTILLEDGRQESIWPATDLNAVLRSLTILWTERQRWKSSFFDTTPDEFEEISKANGIPPDILKEMADLERAYYENSSNTRANAMKRRYLPRFTSRWF